MKLWGSIDVLSDKKQVVTPPSVHPSGTIYQWDISPDQIQKANLPHWLVEYLSQYKSKVNVSSTISTKVQASAKNRRTPKRNDIYNLLESADWVSFYSGITNNIRGNGEWLSSKCPFHEDRHNSFSFNKRNGAWICFAGCGSGNGFNIIQKVYNINFKQAIHVIKGEDLFV